MNYRKARLESDLIRTAYPFMRFFDAHPVQVENAYYGVGFKLKAEERFRPIFDVRIEFISRNLFAVLWTTSQSIADSEEKYHYEKLLSTSLTAAIREFIVIAPRSKIACSLNALLPTHMQTNLFCVPQSQYCEPRNATEE